MEEKIVKELVSIIVPVYKVEEYLDQAVKSLVGQTYSEIEIILVDDGSPDGCGEMCDEWAKRDERIRVIHQENAGLSMARNAGIERSRGAYLLFVDSDDYVEETYVEELYSAISESSADMAIAGVTYLEPDGSFSEKKVTDIQKEEINSLTALLRMEKSGGQKEAYIVVWNKIYKRELWQTIRFPKGKIYEDAFVMPELYGACEKIVAISPCLYVYRRGVGSITAE